MLMMLLLLGYDTDTEYNHAIIRYKEMCCMILALVAAMLSRIWVMVYDYSAQNM